MTCPDLSKRETIKAALFAIIAAETPASADAKSFLSGVNGTVNMQDVYQSLTQIKNTSIPASSQIIISLSYAAPGDLRGFTMVFKRTTSAPPYALGGYVRSADRHLPNGTVDNTNGGYWLLTNETVTPQMFGAPTAGVNGANPAYDDYPAIADMIAYCEADANCITMYNQAKHSKKTINYPEGFYYSSHTVTHNRGVRITGSERAGKFTWNCVIQFAPGVAGMVINGKQTEISGLYLNGVIDTAGAYPQVNGLQLNTAVFLKAVTVNNFSGHGFYVNGVSGDPDCCIFERCSANSCGLDGFWTKGGDFNVNFFVGCNSSGNWGNGFYDSSLLGNSYQSCHTNGNGASAVRWGGLTGGSVNQGYQCQYNGKVYAVVPELETSASTTKPGTADGNRNYPWFLASNTPGRQTIWRTDLGWKAQYPFAILSGSTVTGCYSEANQAPSYFESRALVLSPEIMVWGSGSFDNAAPSRSLFGALWGLTTRTAFVSEMLPVPSDLVQNGVVATFGTDAVTIPHGATFRQTRSISFCGNTGVYVPNSFAFYEGINPTTHDMIWSDWLQGLGAPDYSNSGMLLTGRNTTYQFGTTQVQPGVFTFSRIGLGSLGCNNGVSSPTIIIDAYSAPPGGSGPVNSFYSGQGWIRFNTTPTPGGPFAWICTTAGVGGGSTMTYVWTPLYANLAPCTVANLPTASTAIKGARGMVTDATATTFASIVAGTGKNVVPVYSDGTNWRIG